MRSKFASVLSALLAISFTPHAAHAESTEVNLLSWDEAADVVGKPPAESGWAAEQLLDEAPGTSWANPRSDLSPKELVFEMGTRSSVTRLEFDTAQAYTKERSAKDVTVAVSDKPDGGFVQIAKLSLAAAKDGQSFPLSKPAIGRYLMLIVVNGYGDNQFMEIMDFKAFGKHLMPMKTPDVSGSYSSTYSTVHLQQKGNAASGCYEHAGGLIQNGGFDGRVLRFSWSIDTPPEDGLALLVFAEDGQSFKGHYWHGNKRTEGPADWDGKRTSNDVGSCPYWKPDGHNEVELQLKTRGRVRLYGILFDTDSDHLKAESKATLDALLGAVKNQPTWSFAVEGHTDNVGSDAHNQELSTKRADAVKAYLVKAGVDATRLSTQGFGATRPVGSNDTSSGRAQNRRVEIVKK